MPWHIPEDLQHFKSLTTGHAVLMGRKTYESISKPLANRRNVVVSSKPVHGVETYTSIEDAIRALANEGEVFVIGGGQLYAQLIEQADELFLTLVDADVDGDTFFPPYEHLLATRFRLSHTQKRAGYTIVEYVRQDG
jgi:dihydrofolate reductase